MLKVEGERLKKNLHKITKMDYKKKKKPSCTCNIRMIIPNMKIMRHSVIESIYLDRLTDMAETQIGKYQWTTTCMRIYPSSSILNIPYN